MIVFDAMSYAGKPETGLQPIVLTDRRMYRRNADGSIDKRRGDEALTRQLAREVAAAGAPLILDIEHLPVDIRRDSDAEVERSIEHIGEIIGWIRDERPSVRLGMYALMPLRDYWAPVSGKPEEIREWQRANARLRLGRDDETGRYIAEGLADQVDFVSPSLYTFYDDVPGWICYAEANIDEARRYQKPVYPVIWPDGHPSGTIPGQLIGSRFWQTQVDTCARRANGVVIWGGWDAVLGRTKAWDENVAVRVEIAKRAARISVDTVGDIDKDTKA